LNKRQYKNLEKRRFEFHYKNYKYRLKSGYYKRLDFYNKHKTMIFNNIEYLIDQELEKTIPKIFDNFVDVRKVREGNKI